MKMMMNFDEFICGDQVSLDYFCDDECNAECMNAAIENIMRDFPNHFVYVGITHNPCYRFMGQPTSTKILETYGFEIRASITDELLDADMLTERAHKYDFTKLFVICFSNTAIEIRQRECDCIASARRLDNGVKKRVANTTAGGNGRLKPDQAQYFLYVCISPSKPTFGQA